MSTFRVVKRDRYTTIDRATLNDERLSFKARGILVWLLDKPDDWRCNSNEIAAAGAEGRDAVRTALNELEECGYLVRGRVQDEKGHWLTIVSVHERPVTEAGLSGAGQTDVGKPGANTKTENEDCIPFARSKPSNGEIFDTHFDLFWSSYPKKVDKARAYTIWKRLMKEGIEYDVIRDGQDLWCAYWKQRGEPEFIPYPATWLHNRRWESPPQVINGKKQSEDYYDPDTGAWMAAETRPNWR